MSYSLAFSQAIFTVLFVGDKVEQGFYDFVPTKEVSGSLNIPNPTAVKILGSLASAGIIETREGFRGGVRLAKPPHDITLLDVFTAIETGKPMFRLDHALRVSGEKPSRAQQSVFTILSDAEAAMKSHLAQTTIADVLATLY
ncbi:Rrf2 family transcriptional regulator [Oscillochloris sp. ZM17-4]|uniref:RrF2 family transcriptional regulator n=1 Tax=Oscillochloris sp. ZM17-4 TaxID=2866714 RepID=UPI001C736788|nr:Rrf2 family transcriptional regulator [Oscillochloris sp. ZM17-4]MBX0329788.1 Rrf2 family transcriptional regulator [Oscillochloris sp. ZM17-4]